MNSNTIYVNGDVHFKQIDVPFDEDGVIIEATGGIYFGSYLDVAPDHGVLIDLSEEFKVKEIIGFNIQKST